MITITKTNILKAIVIVLAMTTTVFGYAKSNRLSAGDQAKVRTFVKYLNMENNNASKDVMVRALAKIDAEAIPTLEKMGVEVTHVQGDLYSLYFDVSLFGEIQRVAGVKQVDISRDMRPIVQPSNRKGEPRQVVRPV